MLASDRRGGLSHGAIFGALGVALCLSLLAGGLFYLKFVHFSRVAARHIPRSFGAAIRIDVEQVILFEPVRRSLFPLLNELPRPSTRDAPRLARLQRAADAQLALDLRELVLTWDAAGNWLGIVAGKFPRRGVATAVATEYAATMKTQQSPLKLAGAAEAFQLTPTLAIAQADDGAVLFGNATGLDLGLRAEGALLPEEGPGALAIRGREWVLAAEALALAHWPDASAAVALGSLAGLRGTFEVGSEVTLNLVLKLRPGPPLGQAEVQAILKAAANAHHITTLPRASVQVEPVGGDTVSARISWPREAMLAYSEAAARAILAQATPKAAEL